MTLIRRTTSVALALFVAGVVLVALPGQASGATAGRVPADSALFDTSTTIVLPASPTASTIPAAEASQGVSGVLLGGVGLLVGLVLGAGAAVLLWPRRDQAPDPAPPPPPPAPASPTYADVNRELSDLVRSVIEVRDLLEPNSVLSRRLATGLSAAGVVEFAPVGERFDPTRHHAVDVAPTQEPAQADLVASIQRVGYVDANTLIRVPEVVVFQLQGAN